MATRRAIPLFAVAVAAAALGATTVALGVARLPTPGTESQVAALVAASSSIERLPIELVPPLAQAATDTPGTYYAAAGRHCNGVTQCVFGAVRSKRSIVLFGDSHAQMWLPALAPAAQSLGYRLSLVWTSGCPAATVSVWDAETHSVNQACSSWRTRMVAKIHRLGPALVLLASRTSDIPGPRNHPTTNAAWTAGLERTITELESATTTVAVIGDITVFSPNPLPAVPRGQPGVDPDVRRLQPERQDPTALRRGASSGERRGRGVHRSAALAVHDDVLPGDRAHGRVLRHLPRLGDLCRVPVGGVGDAIKPLLSS